VSAAVFVYPGRKLYGETCNDNTECRETGFCDVWTKKCICPIMRLDTFLQVFDTKQRTCLSAVGKRCTVDKDDGLPPIGCVSNADCRHDGRGPKVFGWCVCRKRYYESKYGLCATVQELQLEEANEYSVSKAQNVVIPTVMMTAGSTKSSYMETTMSASSSLNVHHNFYPLLHCCSIFLVMLLPFLPFFSV